MGTFKRDFACGQHCTFQKKVQRVYVAENVYLLKTRPGDHKFEVKRFAALSVTSSVVVTDVAAFNSPIFKANRAKTILASIVSVFEVALVKTVYRRHANQPIGSGPSILPNAASIALQLK